MQLRLLIKRFLYFMLPAVFIIAMFPAFVSAADYTLTNNTRYGLQQAIDNAGATPTTIIVTQDLSFDISTVSIPVEADITIRSATGSSYTLTKNTSGRHFTLNGKLTLEDITLNGGTIYAADGTVITSGGGGITMETSGNLTMNSGAVIENCYDSIGGGVNVNAGTFTMSGGKIINNYASEQGGGIYVTTSGTVRVTGTNGACTITGNRASGNGGGIFTEDLTYANLNTAASTEFSGNLSSAAYEPPVNAAAAYPNLLFNSVSIADHPLNNYDINNNTSTSPLSYQVTYDANGGIGSYTGSDITPGSADTVLSASATGISRADYTFTGWNTNPNGTGDSYAPGDSITLNGNMTLYAQWAVYQYTVTFETNGGASVNSQTVSFGGKAVRPTDPTKQGYTFDGWYIDRDTFKDKWDFNTAVTGNLTLYAKWTEITGEVQPTEPEEPTESENTSRVLLWILILCFLLALLILVFWNIRRKKEDNSN